MSQTVSPTTDFELSGEGNATEWQTTDSIGLQLVKGQSNYNTYVKVLYSDKGIYMLFVNDDEKLTASYENDFAPLFKEDVVEVFFWPDENIPVYLEYELSPLDHELAIQVVNKDGRTGAAQPWPYQGQRKARHATHVIKNEKGKVIKWTAEIFLPFSLLYPLISEPPNENSHWRANFYRIDYDGHEPSWWAWSKIEINFHDFHHFGKVEFK